MKSSRPLPRTDVDLARKRLDEHYDGIQQVIANNRTT